MALRLAEVSYIMGGVSIGKRRNRVSSLSRVSCCGSGWCMTKEHSRWLKRKKKTKEFSIINHYSIIDNVCCSYATTCSNMLPSLTNTLDDKLIHAAPTVLSVPMAMQHKTDNVQQTGISQFILSDKTNFYVKSLTS